MFYNSVMTQVEMCTDYLGGNCIQAFHFWGIIGYIYIYTYIRLEF